MFLGYYAGYNETGDNKLYIENSDSSSPLIYGEFDNDMVAINGQIKITGGSPGADKVLTSNADGLASWQTPSAGGDNDWTISSNDMYSVVSGNVGIGNINPGDKLDVDGQTETWYYYHFDGLGSVIALSDENGDLVESYSYDVFGTPTIYDGDGDEIATSAVNNPYMFTGRRYDEDTGLYYYRLRDYDLNLGRFMQNDPISYAGGLNLYGYCFNNPINCRDPLGLMTIAPIVTPLIPPIIEPYIPQQLGPGVIRIDNIILAIANNETLENMVLFIVPQELHYVNAIFQYTKISGFGCFGLTNEKVEDIIKDAFDDAINAEEDDDRDIGYAGKNCPKKEEDLIELARANANWIEPGDYWIIGLGEIQFGGLGISRNEIVGSCIVNGVIIINATIEHGGVIPCVY